MMNNEILKVVNNYESIHERYLNFQENIIKQGLKAGHLIIEQKIINNQEIAFLTSIDGKPALGSALLSMFMATEKATKSQIVADAYKLAIKMGNHLKNGGLFQHKAFYAICDIDEQLIAQ